MRLILTDRPPKRHPYHTADVDPWSALLESSSSLRSSSGCCFTRSSVFPFIIHAIGRRARYRAWIHRNSERPPPWSPRSSPNPAHPQIRTWAPFGWLILAWRFSKILRQMTNINSDHKHYMDKHTKYQIWVMRMVLLFLNIVWGNY